MADGRYRVILGATVDTARNVSHSYSGESSVQADVGPVLHLLRIDEMTGLFIRPYFLERVRDDMFRAERYGWPVSLVILSIEKLDEIQSRLGQLVRDNLIATTATMIRKFARNTDIACRYGKDQFALLLPGAAADGAATIAERLHHRLTTHLFETPEGRALTIECHLGVAEFHSGMREVTDFLAAAEHALQQAQSTNDRWRLAPAPSRSAADHAVADDN